MKSLKFYILLGLSLLALVLTISGIVMSRNNEQLQADLQAKQADIGKGGMSQQIGTNLVKEIAVASQNDPKLRDLLAKNGFTVQSGTNAASTPAESPSTTFKP